MPADTLSNDDLTRLYTWVDEIKLSRPKRNIARDFSDGVLVAEVRKRAITRIRPTRNGPDNLRLALYFVWKAADLRLEGV